MSAARRALLGIAIGMVVAVSPGWVPLAAFAADVGPVLDKARSGPCVRDPKLMRRTHMDLLKHTRDVVVHTGMRDGPVRLTACVDCHANAQDGSVLGSPTHFCQGCHAYAAVKIDCFECHSSRVSEPVRAAAASTKGGS